MSKTRQRINTMGHRTTFLSFWDVELSNFPGETFRRRVLSTVEARRLIGSARAAGALVCVAKDDLGAPYCERERAQHRQLCNALRDHADIEVQLKDFFGSDCANPLCMAKVGVHADLLVVGCAYRFAEGAGVAADAASDVVADMSGDERARHRAAYIARMSVEPESIEFCVFEHVELANIDPTAPASRSL